MAEPSTRTVERALALLASICERGGANLADSARDCDLAPSTALRLLRTLETTGFVSREEQAARIGRELASSNSGRRPCPTSR